MKFAGNCLHFWPLSCKVIAFLQWAKSVRSCGPKVPLFVNLDETCMKLNYGQQRGLVISKNALPPGFKHRKEQITSSEAKAAVTMISMVTHDSTIQPLLPQILLGNKHNFTLGLVAALASHKPANFHIWREDSAWNNSKMMCRVLTLLVKCLAAFAETHQIVLVLDVARCHFKASVLGYATRLGVKLVFIPASLTFLLQPLDVFFFWRLKSRLRRKWLELTVASASGTISNQVWLQAVMEVTSSLLCILKWKHAFESVGLLGEGLLSARVLQHLGWQDLPGGITSDLPSMEQLQCVFPRRTKVLRNSLLSWGIPKPKAKAKAKPKAKPKAKAKAAAFGLAHGMPMLH